MQNVKTNPMMNVSEERATDTLFDGFRKCARTKNNRCIVNNYGETYICTVELSLTAGEFIVTLYDEEGRFVASARCDQHDM